jgi:phosphopantetheine--protein transferase-like protein
MEIKTGIDIIDIARFKKKAERAKQFLSKIFSTRELDNKSIETLAGKFAAKEAIIKTDNKLIKNWRDVEILSEKSGRPYAKFKNKKVNIDISISHEKRYAIAIAVLQKK